KSTLLRDVAKRAHRLATGSAHTEFSGSAMQKSARDDNSFELFSPLKDVGLLVGAGDYVPSADRNFWCCAMEVGGRISSGDGALLARQKPKIIVLPKHGQHFFAVVAAVDLEVHRECQVLA